MAHTVVQQSASGVRRHIRRVVTVVAAAAATGLGWAAGRLAHVDYVLQTPLGARQITVVLVIAATAISQAQVLSIRAHRPECSIGWSDRVPAR
jgi:hypothetical protein